MIYTSEKTDMNSSPIHKISNGNALDHLHLPVDEWKKCVLIAFLLCNALALLAQTEKERRVYYLDCSYSMKTNGLWNKVKDNLKSAIDGVADETTEILVIPFAFDKQHHPHLDAYEEKASENGKKRLKAKIDALPMNKGTMTFHSDPIKDFNSSRVKPGTTTYLFLMTDGKNEEKPDLFTPILQRWGSMYGSLNVYGFYVMLGNEARNARIEKIISQQPHFWSVPTADVNINLIRFDNKAIFNARTDKYFDVAYYGDIRGKNVRAEFPHDAPYKVARTEVMEGNRLRVHTQVTSNVHDLPTQKNYPVGIHVSNRGQFDFLVTETIDVSCESIPECSLKITIR